MHFHSRRQIVCLNSDVYFGFFPDILISPYLSAFYVFYYITLVHFFSIYPPSLRRYVYENEKSWDRNTKKIKVIFNFIGEVHITTNVKTAQPIVTTMPIFCRIYKFLIELPFPMDFMLLVTISSLFLNTKEQLTVICPVFLRCYADGFCGCFGN